MSELLFEGVSVERRGRKVLDAVNLCVEANDFVALVGPNGAGKTTLLKTALGLTRPTAGRVRLGGALVTELDARSRAAAVAWLPQRFTDDEPVTLREAVAAARFRFRESYAESLRAAEQALARLFAPAFFGRKLTELSGGERQRLAFAGLIAQDARVLLLDEPGNHLDPAQELAVYGIVGSLWREPRAIVCVTHDVNLLQHVAAPERVRVVGLGGGRLAFDLRLDDSALPAALGELFHVVIEELWGEGPRHLVARPGAR